MNLALVAHIEPLTDVTPAASTIPSSPVSFDIGGRLSLSHHTYSDRNSNSQRSPTSNPGIARPLYRQSTPSEAGVTFVSGTSSDTGSGKTPLMTRRREHVGQLGVHQDSGMRFDEFGEPAEPGPGPSRIPMDAPPAYSSIEP